jgi:hypothetical protein
MTWFRQDCNHDWEEVYSTASPIKNIAPYLPDDIKLKTTVSTYRDFYEFLLNGERVYTEFESYTGWIDQKVCLKCGECSDGMQKFADKIVTDIRSNAASFRKSRKRKNLAKSMWNECEKRGEV